MKKLFNYSKKGVVFTIVAVLFIILITAVYSNTLTLYNPNSNRASSTRIKVLDTYVTNFENYVRDSIDISSYNTLNSMYEYSVINRNFYINSFVLQNSFRNCMNCSYIDCSTKITACPGLSGKDLSSMINKISNLSKKNLNIVTDYTIDSIYIYEDHEFDVNVEVNITYSVYDIQKKNYAVWNRTKTFVETISIIGLYDPLIAVNTNNVSRRKIARTSICTIDYNNSCWNVSTFRQLYLSQEYRHYSNGTSYLSRFMNSSIRSTCCGLESFLTTSMASGYNSYVDYLYWTNTYSCTLSSTDPSIFEINNTAPGFRLDESTMGRYRLTSYGVEVCP